MCVCYLVRLSLPYKRKVKPEHDFPLSYQLCYSFLFVEGIKCLKCRNNLRSGFRDKIRYNIVLN